MILDACAHARWDEPNSTDREAPHTEMYAVVIDRHAFPAVGSVYMTLRECTGDGERGMDINADLRTFQANTRRSRRRVRSFKKVLEQTGRNHVARAPDARTLCALETPARLWRALGEAGPRQHGMPEPDLSERWWLVEIEAPAGDDPNAIALWEADGAEVALAAFLCADESTGAPFLTVVTWRTSADGERSRSGLAALKAPVHVDDPEIPESRGHHNRSPSGVSRPLGAPTRLLVAAAELRKRGHRAIQDRPSRAAGSGAGRGWLRTLATAGPWLRWTAGHREAPVSSHTEAHGSGGRLRRLAGACLLLLACVAVALTTLTDLDLVGNNLTTLPAGVFAQLTSLTSLNLGYNDLNALPAEVFDGLRNLTVKGRL